MTSVRHAPLGWKDSHSVTALDPVTAAVSLRHREHLSPGGAVNPCCVGALPLGISACLSQRLPPAAIKLTAAGSVVDLEPGQQRHGTLAG